MIQPQYAQPYSQGTPSANAVNIQIFEPKAYASPQPAMMPNYTNQLYNYPQASLYMPQQAQMYQPMMPYSQYMPMPYGQYQPQAQTYAVPPQVYTVPPQVVSPQVQEMPAPAIDQNQTVQPAPTQVQAPVQQAVPGQQPAVQQTPEQAQTAPNVEVQQSNGKAPIDVAGLVTNLQNADPAVQEQTITQIANYSQSTPEEAQQVLNAQIMGGLADIVSKDTAQLAGPTQEQMNALNKAAKGEQLTPEETQLAKQKAPRTLADSNKIIAMFTLAMLQKNQRDELDAYMASQGANNNIAPLDTQSLIGFKEIQNAIQNDPNPEVRLAGIQALSYIARPEDAQAIQEALQNSLNDPEPLIQQAAKEVLGKFGTTQQAAPTDAQAQQSAPQAA